MNVFEKEIQIASLYCEGAEADAVNAYLYESVAGDGQSAAAKLKEAIQTIIEKIKEFFKMIKDRIDAAKIKHMLSKAAKENVREIRADIHDKEIANVVAELYKAQNVVVVEAKKCHDMVLARKIDMDEFNEKMIELEDKFNDRMEKLLKKCEGMKLIDTSTPKGQYKVAQLAKKVEEMNAKQRKIVDKLEKDILDFEKKLEAEAVKVAGDEDHSSNAATSKTATFVSRINRKTVAKIVAVFGIVAAAGMLGASCGIVAGYNQGLDDGVHVHDTVAKMLNESTDEFIDSVFGDIFEESAQEYSEDDFMEDLFGDL